MAPAADRGLSSEDSEDLYSEDLDSENLDLSETHQRSSKDLILLHSSGPWPLGSLVCYFVYLFVVLLQGGAC